MKKLGLAIIVVTILCAALLLIHNQYTDYVNPMIRMETDYAKVPKHTQKYYNVQAIDKLGKKLPYKIKYVGGNDPSRQYIVIRHKGQYVKVIDYIAKSEMPRLQD